MPSLRRLAISRSTLQRPRRLALFAHELEHLAADLG